MTLTHTLTLLLLGHVLGDFYFQWDNMATKKKENWKWLVGHGVVYALCMAGVMFTGIKYSSDLLVLTITVCALHILIDKLKVRIEKDSEWTRIKKRIFILDQLIHLVFICVAYLSFGRGLQVNDIVGYIEQRFSLFPFPPLVVLLGVLIILRPVGLLIKYGEIWDFTKKKTPSTDQEGAGKMIGYLERIIVFFLLLHNQFGAIAFVIAAKSVIRFPEINKANSSDNQNALAEYYLIGTLLSMTSVFIVSLLLGLIKTGA